MINYTTWFLAYSTCSLFILRLFSPCPTTIACLPLQQISATSIRLLLLPPKPLLYLKTIFWVLMTRLYDTLLHWSPSRPLSLGHPIRTSSFMTIMRRSIDDQVRHGRYRPCREITNWDPNHTEPTCSRPSRPTGVPPDHIPHARSPRRLSSFSCSTSPTSPPSVTEAGCDIIFHPSYDHTDDNATRAMQKMQGHGEKLSDKMQLREPAGHSHTALTSSPPHSKLLDTLAATTKMASKWRSVITHPTPPSSADRTQNGQPRPHVRHSETSPMDISHDTPFASAEQIAGSYIPPTGAPGFTQASAAGLKHHGDGMFEHLALIGRKNSTSNVLTSEDAVGLRACLPPRQRLTNQWTLLCEFLSTYLFELTKLPT